MEQTKALQVEQALRIVAEQAHATAQLAVTALKALAMKEIELTRIDAKNASVLVVRSEKPVNEELLKQLGGLLGIEVINVGFGNSFEVRP
jgi:hypothetical protein